MGSLSFAIILKQAAEAGKKLAKTLRLRKEVERKWKSIY
jgi:hypothetical protein